VQGCRRQGPKCFGLNSSNPTSAIRGLKERKSLI
jgi:hypothetical protein